MRLDTERLILRSPKQEDARALLGIQDQEFVRKYNCFGDLPAEEEFQEKLESHALAGDMFVLERKGTGEVLGAVGLEQDSLRYGVDAVMLDYYLGEQFARQGYMKEALKSVVRWIFQEKGPELVSARVFTENEGSIALLLSLGFTQEGVLRRAVKAHGGVVYDDGLFSIMRDEFEK